MENREYKTYSTVSSQLKYLNKGTSKEFMGKGWKKTDTSRGNQRKLHFTIYAYVTHCSQLGENIIFDKLLLSFHNSLQ